MTVLGADNSFFAPRVYQLFVSHSWAYGDAYERLIGLLDKAPSFNYINHSVPKDDPIHNAENKAALTAAISAKMAPANVVLVLAGVYATYSDWINTEVSIARQNTLFPKPIIAIEPFGAERTSLAVKLAADKVVGWSTNSIVSAIRELAT